jgi:hypothetical protein
MSTDEFMKKVRDLANMIDRSQPTRTSEVNLNDIKWEKKQLLDFIESYPGLNVMTRAKLLAEVNAIDPEWNDAHTRLEAIRKYVKTFG